MESNFGPLRLAVGGSPAPGYGCAMNVISWENGDTVISDLPTCSAGEMSRVVQALNDTYCKHTTEEEVTLEPAPPCLCGQGHGESTYAVSVLCAECSVKVLAVAHRTIGTRINWLALADGQKTVREFRRGLAVALGVHAGADHEAAYFVSAASMNAQGTKIDPEKLLLNAQIALTHWEVAFDLLPLAPPEDAKVRAAYEAMAAAR